MHFSISRYRHCKPQLPCWVGGELQYVNGQFYLCDATFRFELQEPPTRPFAEMGNGDQILVHVRADHGHRLEINRVTCVVTSQPRRGNEDLDLKAIVEFPNFVRHIRDFLWSQGLHEILTPTLVRCPGLEPSLEPFAVEVSRGRDRRTAYLPTSPEIHLKKALSRGWTDIFEIKSCFRKGEFSAHHENEFTMLEWYRAFADLELIELDLRKLLDELFRAGFLPASASPTVTTFAQLFAEHLDFTLTPGTGAEELRDLCLRLRLHPRSDDTFNDLFHRILLDYIEPQLLTMGPVIVRDFPPSQAALARLTRDGWADRFEFYWQGLELANAFNEVNDPLEQARRWQIDQRERLRLGTSAVATDPDLIGALERGMPPAGGIALGLERLYMACRGLRDIRKLKMFNTEHLFG